MHIYFIWLIIVVFVYFCYTRSSVRPLGYTVIILISANLLFTRLTKGVWGDVEASFSYMLMILTACVLGQINHYRDTKNKNNQKNKSHNN